MSTGFQTKLGIDTANPITKAFEFLNENVVTNDEIADASGLRGTASMRSERTRKGLKAIGGSISMQPSPEELALLLPWILSGTPVSTTYPVADTVASRYITIDRVAKVFTYSGCCVSRATFQGSEGSILGLTLDILGTGSSIANAGTFPGSPTYQNTPPWMFTDTTLTVLSTTRDVKNWTLTIDNMLQPVYNNSITPTAILRQGRRILFNCQNPFTSAEVDLFNQALAGAAATLALAFNNYSLSFAFAALQFPQRDPSVPGRAEVTTNLEAEARMASSTESLIVTLDSTP